MNTGTMSVLVAFGAAGAAFVAYALAWSGQKSALRLARVFLGLMLLSLGLASVLLMAAILSDDFSLTYVTQYSARALPAIYKISAFWAGQQGTVLLWATIQGFFGLLLARRRDDWEPAVMTFFFVPQGLLLLLLVALKPFESAPPIADGSGLNPLLQDPWMAIHPPIVFIGYAALAVPFALAMAALARNNFDDWIPRVLPWTLLAVLTLGAGVFIGGFWAYKVLGWGGYWGWDPVENSSLAPWLVAGALIHGLLTQRSQGALRRTNIVLATSAYVLAIYSTYLTRSGVLSNFSVHSFGDGGINTYLLTILGTCTALPLAFMIFRFRQIKSDRLRWDLSLHSIMPAGILVLLLLTVVLVVGTSWPILSSLAGTPSSPGAGFYNSVTLPMGLALALTLALAPLIDWLAPGRNQLIRRLIPGAILGLAAAVVPPIFGFWPKGGVLVLLFLGAAVAALVASLIKINKQLLSNPMGAGAGLAHAGIALMCIGIVTTSAFDSFESARLETGKPMAVLGSELTLQRYVAAMPGTEPHFQIDVQPAEGPAYVAKPIMFRYSNGSKTMARPHVERFLLGDYYISPVSYDPGQSSVERIALSKNHTHPWGDVSLTFMNFTSHAADEQTLRVAAKVDVSRGDEQAEMILELLAGPKGANGQWVEIPMTGGAMARLDGMKVETGSIHVTLQRADGQAQVAKLSVEVSRKPLVGTLWIGMVLVGGGAGLAAYRRRNELLISDTMASAAARRPWKQREHHVPAGMVPLTRREAER